jgi:molybdate transport system substrate-binding protein
VLRGEPADVVVLSDAAIAQLRSAGKLADGAATVPLGQVVVALAVPASATPPDLGNETALRAALLAAPSIAYADPARGATAGTHFSRVVDALGLRDALASKLTVLPFGVDVIEAVATGRFALGVSQSSEIVQHRGVRLAGPLPTPHGQATAYGAAIVRNGAAAQAWQEFLTHAPAIAAFRASGFADGASN